MEILITGGTGSLGSKLVEHFYGDHEITVLSRDGHKQQALANRFPDVTFVLGDICDRDLVHDAVSGQDVVIHAAALKILPQGQNNPMEFFRVNTLGTETVGRCCFELGVPRALFISSDKSVQPTSVYGATKLLGESIFSSYGYPSLRYGNVVGSQGSFIQVWRRMVERGEKITIRKPDPTRFFLKLEDAVDLVKDALDVAIEPRTYVPRTMKAFSIMDIVGAMGIMEYIEEPLLPGEKRAEILLAMGESAIAVSDLLAEVRTGYKEDGLDRSLFCSDTAPRMSGKEFLELVETE